MAQVTAVFKADIGQFRQSLAAAQTAVTAFDRTVGQVNTDLKRFANEFSGANVQRQAETMARAIEEIGGAARLSQDQMRKASRTVEEAIDSYRRFGTQAPAALRSLSQELRTLQAEAQRTGDQLRSGLTQGLGIGAGLSIAGVVQGLVSSLGAVVTEGNKVAALSVPFERLAGGAIAAQAKLEALRQATNGLVSDSQLLTASNQATVLGLDRMGLRFEEVARVARVLAQSMGQDVGQGVADLVNGLAKGSSEVLNNLGVIVRAEDAYKTYAERMGKTADALTDVERQTAVAVIGFEQATRKAQELGDVPLTAAQHFDRLLTAMVSIGAEGVRLVNNFLPFRDLLAEMAGFADAIRTGLKGAPATMPGFGPGATAGAASYGVAGLPSWAMLGQQPPREFISAGVGGVSVVDGRLSQRRAADADREARGIASANAALARATQQRTDAEKRLAEIQKRLGFIPAPATDAPTKTGRSTKPFVQREYDPLVAAVTSGRFIDPLVAQAKRADEAFGRLLRRAQQEQAETLARGTANALRSAATTTLTTLSQTLWSGSSLRPARGEASPLVAGMAGSGTSTSGVLAPISSWGRAAVQQQQQAVQVSRSWKLELQGVVQAFANLAQIAGPAMGGVARGLGTVLAGVSAGQQLAQSLAKAFPTTFGTNTRAGAGVAGGVAGLTTGMSLGGLFTNRGLGFAAGAAGGAGAGALATMGTPAMPLGIAVGAIVGGLSGMFAAAANAKNLRSAKDVQSSQLVAQFGSLDELLNTVGRLGLNQQSFLQAFYGEPKQFAQAVGVLNQALAEETRKADALAKSLQQVAKVQGVLSKEQFKQIMAVRQGGPATDAINQFLEGQTLQAETGILSAVEALSRYQGNVLADFGGSVKAAAAGLAALFGEALRRGESAVQILSRLGGAMNTVGGMFTANGGQMPPGFAQLQDLASIVSGENTGIAVQTASGLGSALAGFANTGMFAAMPELFGDIASGIGAAWKALENFGAGGQRGLAIFQPYLQTLWELIDANPELKDQLDDQTRALLDFASANGVIGPAFRDSTEKMLTALDRLITKLDEFITRMGTAAGLTLPTPPTAPPNTPGSGSGSGGDYEIALARGGIVTRPTRALIGEAGPEAVIPLSQLRMGGKPTTQTITVTLDGRVLARSVARGLPNAVAVYGAA